MRNGTLFTPGHQLGLGEWETPWPQAQSASEGAEGEEGRRLITSCPASRGWRQVSPALLPSPLSIRLGVVGSESELGNWGGSESVCARVCVRAPRVCLCMSVPPRACVGHVGLSLTAGAPGAPGFSHCRWCLASKPWPFGFLECSRISRNSETLSGQVFRKTRTHTHTHPSVPFPTATILRDSSGFHPDTLLHKLVSG